MATTAMTILSERAGQVTLTGSVSNIDSATALDEFFTLPAGFGDCFLMAITISFASIETAVTAGDMRGLHGRITASGGGKDFFEIGPWYRESSTGMRACKEQIRPVLWRGEESLRFQAFSEDTGAGDTSDIGITARVARLRNQTAPAVGGFTYPQP